MRPPWRSCSRACWRMSQGCWCGWRGLGARRCSSCAAEAPPARAMLRSLDGDLAVPDGVDLGVGGPRARVGVHQEDVGAYVTRHGGGELHPVVRAARGDRAGVEVNRHAGVLIVELLRLVCVLARLSNQEMPKIRAALS